MPFRSTWRSLSVLDSGWGAGSGPAPGCFHGNEQLYLRGVSAAEKGGDGVVKALRRQEGAGRTWGLG